MVVDWSDLTADQQRIMLASPHLDIKSGCELLNFDLTVQDDITGSLVPAGGQVQWTGNATIHRGCTATLKQRLVWGVDLIRLYRVWTDPITGLSARANRGVFIVNTPGQDLGADLPSYQVTGQDRMAWLTRQVGYSYVIHAGTNVLAAIAQVFVDAGLTGVLIDSSSATALVPTDMVYPLIPVSDVSSATTGALPGDSGQTASDPSSPATWVQILNDLAGLIAYRGVWADEAGYYRLGPYADPGTRTPTASFTANLASDLTAIRIRVARSVQRVIATFNTWIFTNSTMPDVAGVPAVPTEGAGIYTVTNTDDGPAAINAMNGLIFPTQISYPAADQASLEAMGDAKVAADKRTVVTGSLSTVSYPPASHYDVFTLTDAALDEGSCKAEATQWTDPLDGASTAWQWTKVG